MKTFIAPGTVVPMTAPSGGVVSGQAFVVGATFGVATHDAAQGATVECQRVGVVRIGKTTGVNWLRGARLYLVPGTGLVTNATTSGNFPIGTAGETRVNADTTALVILDGIATVAL